MTQPLEQVFAVSAIAFQPTPPDTRQWTPAPSARSVLEKVCINKTLRTFMVSWTQVKLFVLGTIWETSNTLLVALVTERYNVKACHY